MRALEEHGPSANFEPVVVVVVLLLLVVVVVVAWAYAPNGVWNPQLGVAPQPQQDEEWRPSRQSTRWTPTAHSLPKPDSGYTSDPFGLSSADHPRAYGDGYRGHFLAWKTE
jgi:hypothetical protein